MIKEPGIYKLKAEFFKENQISVAQYDRRKEDLLEWWKDFYEYEIIEGKPIRINIKEVFDEYKPMPRQLQKTEQKIRDYEEYVKNNLPKDFKPESKAHMARGAISSFGYEKYNHTSDAAVARRYVGPAMERYGEKNDNHVWVDCRTYEPLREDNLDIWMKILDREHIGEKEAAIAFYKQEQGLDITKEKNAYKTALRRMKEQTGITPVKVAEWRLAEIMLMKR